MFLGFQPIYRDPPSRPGYGRIGRSIQLHANHFQVKFPRDSSIYHYDVIIKPEKCPSRINREVIHNLQESNKHALNNCKLAFDGKKNLYTSKPLPPSVNMRDIVSELILHMFFLIVSIVSTCTCTYLYYVHVHVHIPIVHVHVHVHTSILCACYCVCRTQLLFYLSQTTINVKFKPQGEDREREFQVQYVLLTAGIFNQTMCLLFFVVYK